MNALRVLTVVVHMAHSAYHAWERHKTASGLVTIGALIDELADEAHVACKSLGIEDATIRELMEPPAGDDVHRHKHLADVMELIRGMVAGALSRHRQSLPRHTHLVAAEPESETDGEAVQAPVVAPPPKTAASPAEKPHHHHIHLHHYK